MRIVFNGVEPPMRYYRLGVRENNLADELELIVDKIQNGIDLSEFKPFLKLSTPDFSFVNKDGNLEITPGDEKITLRYTLSNDVTVHRAVDIQVQFERYDETNVIVWQSIIFNIAFSETLCVDKIIVQKIPNVIQDLSRRMKDLEDNPSTEIVESQSYLNFPAIGQAGKIYVDVSNNKTYRFDTDKLQYIVIGSDYSEIKIINGNGGV